MTIEETIIKAIKGGWRPINDKNAYHLEDVYKHCPNDSFLLDPLFFQSLGKSLGWNEFSCSDCYSQQGFNSKQCITCLGERERVEMESWKVHWHCLVDFLAEGKSVEEFFETLRR